MLTLSMIVKNEEKYLADCLKSVKDVVDEIVIVDTGSNDLTIEIAKKFNAKIYLYKWENDFSAARNFALEKSTGNWILYLDADERLSASSINLIKKLTKAPGEKGYYCTIQNTDDVRNRPSVMKYVRLFPRSEKIRFTGKIHEQIEQSILNNNYRLENSDVEIIHIGYNISGDDLKYKAKRNLDILLKEFKENPSSYIAYQLGQTYGILDEQVKASDYFIQSVEDVSLKKEYKSVAYRYLCVNEAEKKNWEKALEYIGKSLECDSSQPLPLLVSAKINLQLKDFRKAGSDCKKAYQANKKYINGKNNSYQTIYLSETDILYECLNIAVSSENNELFNFFFPLLKSSGKNIQGSFYELVNILVNHKNINNPESYLGEINDQNIDFIANLLNKYVHSDKGVLLKSLVNKYPQHSVLRTTYGLYLSSINKFSEAADQLEKAYDLKADPSIVFYLVSAYLQTTELNKIKILIEKAENYYSGQKNVMDRISLLKQKIYPLLLSDKSL